MTAPRCDRISFDDLTDYVAGELVDSEAESIEEHIFACPACAARAAEVEALATAIRPAVRSAEVAGFVTNDVLNRFSRDGLRVRTFALSPGDVVACAVWEGDEVMVLRLRADFGDAREFTLSQRVAGVEMVRATGIVSAESPFEAIYIQPAAAIRQLPVVEVEIVLAAHQDGEDRAVASYRLLHGGSLQR